MSLQELYSKTTGAPELPSSVRQLLSPSSPFHAMIDDDDVDEFEETQDEDNEDKTSQLLHQKPLKPSEFRQFQVLGEDASDTVKDSIHLDWTPLRRFCPECGVNVKLWDGFAHR